MSEEAVAAAPSAGALLRQAREAAGLHVAALAVSLKVPVRKVEALEDDRYDLLPDAVFARALASSICRTLKVDAQPILERLPQGTTPRLVQDGTGLNAPFRAPGDVAAPAWREQLRRPVTLAVGALLLGALAILLAPTLRRDEAAVVARPEPAAVPMGPAVVVQPVSAEAPQATSAPAAPPAAGATGAAPAPVAATPPADVAAVPVAAPPTAPPAAPAAPVAAAVTDGVVVFRVTGPSWVEVVDSQGRVPLRRILAAGETAGASGSLPLAVTVGSASTTAVEVRGRRFDLGAVAKDNVARFEVK